MLSGAKHLRSQRRPRRRYYKVSAALIRVLREGRRRELTENLILRRCTHGATETEIVISLRRIGFVAIPSANGIGTTLSPNTIP
jgi:hypothetical protein